MYSEFANSEVVVIVSVRMYKVLCKEDKTTSMLKTPKLTN